MQRLFLALFAVFLAIALPVQDAEARRMGSGKSLGMQRQAPVKREASPSPSQNQAQNSPAQAPANAAPGKRSWMGPLAGLAAGIGLAALLSHFGLGEGVANFLMLLLAGLAVFMLVRWLLGRKAPQQPAYAGAGAAQPMRFEPAQPVASAAAPVVDTPAAAPQLPAGFDATAFVRQAKVNFIRMQAANDAGNLDDLREFTSPEMYAELKMDIEERNGAKQQTEVLMLEAEVLEAVEEGSRQIVSVRFHGMLREDSEASTPFDEVWHLARPADASRGWVVAGIQQSA